MNIYSAKNDIPTEDYVILKNDVVAVLEENDTSVIVNVKKDSGFDLADKEYTVTINKNMFNEEFTKIDEIDNKPINESTKKSEETEDDDVNEDEDLKVDDSEKEKMITQKMEEIQEKLRKDNEERSLQEKCSIKVKENVEKRINDLKSVKDLEEKDLKEAIQEEINKLVTLVENKTITEPIKNKIKFILEKFLTAQISSLSETFDDRLKLKVMEIEQQKETEIKAFIKEEKIKIDNYIDYVSRELMMEMKNSFVDEEILKESLSYKEDLQKLQEKFNTLNKSYVSLKQNNDKNVTDITTLKETNTKLKNKVNLLIKEGLIRDITEDITDEKSKKLIEESANGIKIKNFEQFYNDLKDSAINILKEQKVTAKINKLNRIDAIKEKYIKEEKETVLTTDSISPIFESKREQTADDIYSNMVNK